MASASSRDRFAETLAADAAAGRKALLLAPLGAGKTDALLRSMTALRTADVPFVFLDLFTAASTPERLVLTLADALKPFVGGSDEKSLRTLVEETNADRHNSSSCLLRLFDLLASHSPRTPFVWIIDEVTEIRSLAYFPDLGHVEQPFMKALMASRGAILSSSYPALALDLFPGVDSRDLPGLVADDLEGVPSLRSDGSAVSAAIAFTHGHAATLLPLLADMKETRNFQRSLVRLLLPGGALELICRRQYEVLLMRSRGYAVCKRAAEVVAQARRQRLTDLFPHLGRTAGASRQYLHWLVEVGLLTQIRKRYDFADPTVGLWASLYLGRGDHPSVEDITNGLERALTSPVPVPHGDEPVEDEGMEEAALPQPPQKKVDRFEEID